MARIPYPDLETASHEFRGAVGPDPINLARMFGHAEPAALGLLSLGGALLGESELDARLRELIILRICALTGCDYEARQHRPHGKAAALSEQEMDAVSVGSADHVFTSEQRAILKFAETLFERSQIADETFVEVRKLLSARQLMELILVIGFYTMICWSINALEIDPEKS